MNERPLTPAGARRLLACGLLLAAQMSLAAPLTFNTALPVATGEFVYRAQAVVNRARDDSLGTTRERTVNAAVSTLGYGASGRLALFGVVPLVDKELERADSSGRTSRQAGGLGDISLLARYTLYRSDATGRSLRLAPFVGIELPTGDDDRHDAAGRLPSPLQPGSGAFDGFGGAVVTLQTLDYQLDAQLAYRRNGRANGYRAGDEWRLDGSLQYRLWPGRLGAGTPAFLYGVLEAGLARRGKDRFAGADDPDSGGTTLTLTPGLQYVTRRWIVEAGVEIPIARNPNGRALQTDYVVRGGFRVNF